MLLTTLITLFIVAFVLYMVEVFLMPGFGVCGILSAVSALLGLGIAYANYGLAVGLALTAAVAVVGFLLLYWVMHSRRIERLSLHAQIDSSVADERLTQIAVGDRGVALTRLALVGNARIGDVECEVRSAKGFIEEGTPIVVTKLHLSEVCVVPADNASDTPNKQS